MTDLFASINDFLWSYILIAALIGCGLWFTWRTRFVQYRMVGEMIRLLGDSAKLATNGQRHISSFQAFAVSVATRVGTGNLAGVATAIAIGGPGAIFWMWLIALMGSATAFVESTLGQLFKQHHEEGFIGGRYVFRLLDDYRRQKRQGIKDPVFHRHQLPEIEADIDCWE